MENLWKTYGKPMEMYGRVWKCMEKIAQKNLLPSGIFFSNFSVFCCMENVTKENLWKIYGKSIENLLKFMEIYGNV